MCHNIGPLPVVAGAQIRVQLAGGFYLQQFAIERGAAFYFAGPEIDSTSVKSYVISLTTEGGEFIIATCKAGVQNRIVAPDNLTAMTIVGSGTNVCYVWRESDCYIEGVTE